MTTVRSPESARTAPAVPTYHDFVADKESSRLASWTQFLSTCCRTHRAWLNAREAYERNLAEGMVEAEAAYHALVNS